MKVQDLIVSSFIFLFLTVPLCGEERETLSFSHSSGSYREDIALAMKPQKEGVRVYFSFVTGGSEREEEASWILYREPLELSALPGEERFYLLRVRAVEDQFSWETVRGSPADEREGLILKEYNLPFLIDKRRPLTPRVNMPPGEYNESLALTFEGNDQICYSVNQNVFEQAVPWDRQPVSLPLQKGRSRHYLVQVYSKDKAGNRSPIESLNYDIRESEPERKEPLLKIMSPIPGQFANYQLLFIRSRNLRWIRYSLDNSDPVEKGVLYQGPKNLILTGKISVSVAAETETGEMLRDTVSFEVNPASGSRVVSDVQSGVYDHSLKVGLYAHEDLKLYYNYSERVPGLSDYVYSRSLFIKPIENTVKYTVLRVRPLHGQNGWGPEYRYFYVQDTRSGALEGRDVPSSQPSAEDSTTQSGNSEVQQEVADRIAVERRPMHRANGSVILTVRSEQNRKVVYEIAFNSIPPIPNLNSPAAQQKMALSVPFGMEGTFNLRFASIGADGSMTHLEKPVTVEFDRKPPGLPDFSFPPRQEAYDTGFKLVLTGEGTFEYELTDDGTVPPDPTEGSLIFRDYISLEGQYNQRLSYYIKLRCRDELGNASETFGPFLYRIDLREPELPELTGIEDGAVFNQETVTLSLKRSNVHVHYTLSEDGGEPPDPTVNSPILEENLNFSGEKDKVKTIRVKLLPFSQFYQLFGKITSLTFRIDLKKPGLPKLLGVNDGGRYNQPVKITIQPDSVDDTIFVSYSDTGIDPPDPVTSGTRYSEPLGFDCAEGKEVLIELRVAALSKHGNRCEPDLYARFTMDKKPPTDPKVTGIPTGGVSKDSVRIGFESAEGKIYYSISDDGSIPRLPRIDPKNLFTSLVYLPGKEGEEVIYRIAARAVDELGNTSRGLRINSVTVDRKIPMPPDEPEILDYWNGETRKTIVSWDIPQGYRLYYSLSDPNEGKDGFELYTDSLTLDIPTGKDFVDIRAFLEDPAGNRSSVASFVSRPERKPIKPTITGVQDGAVYNSKIAITLDSYEGVIRYELSTDGTPPPPVSSDSPEGKRAMIFDVDPGESLTFRLRIRTFHPDRPELSSDPISVSFVIDKSPPLIPEAIGIENRGYYLGSRVVRFKEQEGEIFYSISVEHRATAASTDSFNPYEGEFNLEGQEGETILYTLEAYAVDAAGNRSRSNAHYQLHIDRKGIYVSSSGDDDNEGTRDHPFRSIPKGVDYLRRSGRRILYLSAGSYELTDTITLNGDLLIQGGLNPLAWDVVSGAGATSVVAAEDFKESRPLFNVAGGHTVFQNVTFRDPAGRSSSILQLSGGIIELDRVSVSLQNRAEMVGIEQKQGRISLKDCQFEAKDIQMGAHLRSTGGTIEARGCVFKGPSSAVDFTAVSLSGVAESSWEEVEFIPGSGKLTRAVIAKDSSLSLLSCSVTTGEGKNNAVGLDLKNCILKIRDSVIRNSSGAHYSVGLLAVDSKIVVEKSHLQLEGRYGAIGIKTRASTLDVTSSRLQGKKTLEFLYLINQEGGKGRYFNNILEGGTTQDAVCVFLTRTQGDWYNNTILAGTGTNTTHGFHIRESRSLRFVNNILVRQTDRRGHAFYVVGAIPDEIRTNCLFGWESLIYRLERGAGREPVSIADFDDLNYLDYDRNGGPIHKNIQESPDKTFAVAKDGIYRLAPGSLCVDAGTNVGVSPYDGPTSDIEGERRPALHIGIKPQYDIGADEYH
jgi:hypothetical protein